LGLLSVYPDLQDLMASPRRFQGDSGKLGLVAGFHRRLFPGARYIISIGGMRQLLVADGSSCEHRNDDGAFCWDLFGSPDRR